MNSFTPGDIIYKKDTTLCFLVLAVATTVPPCNPGAVITFLPLGENKPSGPIFAVPSHWELLLKDPR